MKEFRITKSPIEEDLIVKVEPVVTELGLALCDIDVIQSQQVVIRIFLESPDGLNGRVSIEDCTRVHRLLGPMFDVWEPLGGAYTLELSSPGEKPKLRLSRHFEEVVGHKINFKTKEALVIPGEDKRRRNWRVKLVGIDPSKQELLVEDYLGQHQIALEKISHVHWDREWKL